MKILFSVPTGYHLRELVLPLRRHLESDGDITEVYIITPAADYASEIFPEFSKKFTYYKNPTDDTGYTDLFEQLAPDIVVTDTVGNDELDYPILKCAADLGIKTLTFIASWDNVWKIERLMKAKRPIHIADHIIVWNEMMKAHMRRLFPALSERSISVIGAPRFDYFKHDDKIPSKAELYTHLGLSDIDLPLIHLATTELYPLDYVAKTVKKAMDNGDIPKSYLYASVHPGGNMKNHEKLRELGATVLFSFGRKESAQLSSFAYQPTESDIYMLIALFKYTAVLINHSSSVALESMIAGTPSINVQYGAPLDWFKWRRSPVYRDFKEHYDDLVRDGATYIARSPRELVASIQDAITHPDEKGDATRKTLARMITTTDSTTGEKVLAKIKEQLQ